MLTKTIFISPTTTMCYLTLRAFGVASFLLKPTCVLSPSYGIFLHLFKPRKLNKL